MILLILLLVFIGVAVTVGVLISQDTSPPQKPNVKIKHRRTSSQNPLEEIEALLKNGNENQAITQLQLMIRQANSIRQEAHFTLQLLAIYDALGRSDGHQIIHQESDRLYHLLSPAQKQQWMSYKGGE